MQRLTAVKLVIAVGADGLINQEVPLPADRSYTAFSEDAYTSGKRLPNADYLCVIVSPAGMPFINCLSNTRCRSSSTAQPPQLCRTSRKVMLRQRLASQRED